MLLPLFYLFYQYLKRVFFLSEEVKALKIFSFLSEQDKHKKVKMKKGVLIILEIES